jgi:hypothetical protein
MNVILVSRDGILDTPVLVKHNTTAEATFESIVRELLGDDADDIDFFCDTAIDQVNNYLKSSGITITWFVDIDVNKYKN